MKKILALLLVIVVVLAGVACGNATEKTKEPPQIASLELKPQNGEMSVGDKKYVTLVVSPENALAEGLVWTSSDTTIATVDNEGLVTALTAGEVTFTVTAPNGVTASNHVAVYYFEEKDIIVSAVAIDLVVGDTHALKVTFEPENASDKTLKWQSSNEKVATVDENGKITALTKGLATITVETAKGLKKTVTVSVTNPIVWHKAGMYEVGKDIPAGTYYIVATGNISAYFRVDKDTYGKLSSIVANDNFSTFTYISVSKGQYLTVERGQFTLAEDAPLPKPIDGVYGEGMYLVGRDIPAGKYLLTNVSDYRAYVAVSKNCSHSFRAIITNDNFSNTKYISVKKGQYLTVVRAEFTLVK